MIIFNISEDNKVFEQREIVEVYTEQYTRLLQAFEEEDIDIEFIESYAFNYELKIEDKLPWSPHTNKTMPWVCLFKSYFIDQNHNLFTKC